MGVSARPLLIKYISKYSYKMADTEPNAVEEVAAVAPAKVEDEEAKVVDVVQAEEEKEASAEEATEKEGPTEETTEADSETAAAEEEAVEAPQEKDATE